MGDIVDKANDDMQRWLDGRIAQCCADSKPSAATECIDCGEEIGMARKQAVPHAVRCIDCQTEFEKRGK